LGLILLDEARLALELTQRMHVIASTAEGARLTLAEIETMAEEELARERGESGGEALGRQASGL
jgi:hypothetical protein